MDMNKLYNDFVEHVDNMSEKEIQKSIYNAIAHSYDVPEFTLNDINNSVAKLYGMDQYVYFVWTDEQEKAIKDVYPNAMVHILPKKYECKDFDSSKIYMVPIDNFKPVKMF